MAKDTRERILAAALEMFSKNGYAGTNIRELAASLGMGKSSMYRHFKSKEEIWNTLLDELTAYYEERFGSPERIPPVPGSPDELVEMTMRMAAVTVHDEKIVKTRKILTIEQYRDDRAKELATSHFLTGLTEMFTRIFSGMMENGHMRGEDPEMLAFEYIAPISALIHLCDREPEKTSEAMDRIEAFSRHFVQVYGQEKQDGGIMTARKLTGEEIPCALKLAWDTFSELDAPDCPEEAVSEFKRRVNDGGYLSGIEYYGAFQRDVMIGMIGIRSDQKHICLFFVHNDHQRLPVGMKMLELLLRDYPGKEITLDSSPYDVLLYMAMGFAKTGEERTENGLRYVQMKYTGERVILRDGVYVHEHSIE